MVRRIAIANVQYHDQPNSSSNTFSCGLIKWCRSAAALAQQPFLGGAADVVVFTNAYHRTQLDCRPSPGSPQPRILPFDNKLELRIRRWGTAMAASGVHKQHRHLGPLHFALANLFKWEVVRHVEYAAVFLTDVDVDFFFRSGGAPPKINSSGWRALEHTWTLRYRNFLQSEMQLVAVCHRSHSKPSAPDLKFAVTPRTPRICARVHRCQEVNA